jgi:hypothetical protein
VVALLVAVNSRSYVLESVEDRVARLTVYTDVDDGRAAAERPAEERTDG